MSEQINRLRDRMEKARKRLTTPGKAANGVEAEYAAAYAELCRIDPSCRPLRGKYR